MSEQKIAQALEKTNSVRIKNTTEIAKQELAQRKANTESARESLIQQRVQTEINKIENINIVIIEFMIVGRI